jgi:2'-deoxynucleoside 5'-phosphate N-hydrolase
MADATLQVGEAYVSGALTSLEDGARTRLFYELLAEVVEGAGLRAYLPHRVTDPVTTAHLEPRAVYDIDRAHVTGSRVVVAYAGIPSFGVGIEVELAREHGVPVILVVERERAVSRLLLGNPAVVEVVRFTDLEGLRRALIGALERVREVAPGEAQAVSDDVVVQRFLASLGEARHLPDGEVAALLRIGELDGEASSVIRDAVATGRLFGAGLRDLVGRYALRGIDLGVFILRDVLEKPLAETARMVGSDPRAAKRHLEAARAKIGLAADAKAADVAQWLVTELVAPPTRALQLHLFGSRESNG